MIIRTPRGKIQANEDVIRYIIIILEQAKRAYKAEGHEALVKEVEEWQDYIYQQT